MGRVGAWFVQLAEIVTVGLPFCVFKLLTGAIALHSPSWRALGHGLVAFGVVDTLLNLVNLFAVLVVRRRITGACLLDVAHHRIEAAADTDLGLATDVLLSFALVAIVVGFGLLAQLPAWMLVWWNAAVVLNVLGAGVGRLLAALRAKRTVA